ncbi:hypothetical protein F4808DRAFT_416654 [Astrocystis sublimbata]|nr:hypothetical protein F4808DRAFT_416654 [Astrocystis sublimbata]
MARNVGPGVAAPDAPSSGPGSSPSGALDDDKIRRVLVKIPSAQKKLLDGYSWASKLSQRTNGFINVPPEVLEQLKDSYSRRGPSLESDKAGVQAHVAADGAEVDRVIPGPSGKTFSAPIHDDGRGEGDDEAGDDDEEEARSEHIPWSQSPDSHRFPRDAKPREPSEEPGEERSQPFDTQLPKKSPLKPTLPTSPAAQTSLPSLSQESHGLEDELEVEVPVALAYDLKPINKSAQPMLATPPSAQVVPSTLDLSLQSGSTSESARMDSQPKPQSRKPAAYKRVGNLYQGPKPTASSSHLHTNTEPAKDVAVTAVGGGTDAGAESSLSTHNTSSSIVPSTADDRLRNIDSEKQTAIQDIRPGQIPVPTANIGFTDQHSPSAPPQLSSVQVAVTPSRKVHPPKLPAPLNRPMAPPAAAPETWMSPFVFYTTKYPRYDGGIQDFITACIYIQLQVRRIRTSLYDDFIRAWFEGYLPYVRECDEAQPPQKALRAIEWYNDIDDDPIFTKRVVTRDNLQGILNFYPKELNRARLALGITSSQGSNDNLASSSLNDPSTRISSHHQMHAPSKGKEPMRNVVEIVDDEVENPTLPPVPKPRMSAFSSSRRISDHRSSNALEGRPKQRDSLTRSISESTHFKRVAATDLRSEGTKRVASVAPGRGNRTLSDSGSTTSNLSARANNSSRSSVAPGHATAKRSAKATEDPEERRRRKLAKHFKQRMAERDSIASSAPVADSVQRPKK